MDGIKKRYASYRFLKTVSYLIGFPLLFMLVFAKSIQFFGEKVYKNTAWYGIGVILIMWLVVIILQIATSKLFKKNYKIKTLFILVVTIGLMLTGAMVIDAVGTKTIKNVQEDYKNTGINIDEYAHQVNWVVPVTSGKSSISGKYVSSIDNFLRIYNIGYTSSNYGGSKNTDLSPITYNAEADAYYSQNGMYSDGYVFGIKQAVDILITYHQTRIDYKTQDKNVDDELDAVLLALESNPSSAWNKYKSTAEYKNVYGTNGEAYKYMLTEERLNDILGVLGAELAQSADGIQWLLELFGVDELAPLLSYINKNLSVDDIVEVVNALGLFDGEVTKAELMVILKDFSFYQSPKVKPIYDFIENEQLRKYAFAKYYATVHGAKVGSVLVGKNIGEVTMDNSGYPSSFGYSLKQLYQLKADMSYKSFLYPLMVARRFLYLMTAVMGLSSILFCYFQKKEKDAFNQIIMGGR